MTDSNIPTMIESTARVGTISALRERNVFRRRREYSSWKLFRGRDGLPREHSGRDFPACVPDQLSVGLGGFRRRNPKHRVSAISRDRIPNGRDAALWVFTSLQCANSLPQQLPNEGHPPIRGSQVFQCVDGDGALALLRLVVSRLALTLFMASTDRLRASQRARQRVQISHEG